MPIRLTLLHPVALCNKREHLNAMQKTEEKLKSTPSVLAKMFQFLNNLIIIRLSSLWLMNIHCAASKKMAEKIIPIKFSF